MSNLEKNVEAVLSLISERVDSGDRFMIAIAGPPGSGKSTLAEAVVECLNQASGKADLVPVDGYHLDVEMLEQMGLLARRGAPDTFDAMGFLDMLQRARQGSSDIEYPVFDRARDCAIKNARRLSVDTDIVVVEGNYLLLDAPVWRELRSLFDVSVFLQPSMNTLEDRLLQRWLSLGFSREQAANKVYGNDLKNAQRVLAESVAADLTLGEETVAR